MSETTTPKTTRKTCEGCKGTGWKGGVHLSVICDAGCAGSGTYPIREALQAEAPAVYEDRITEYGITQRLQRSVRIF